MTRFLTNMAICMGLLMGSSCTSFAQKTLEASKKQITREIKVDAFDHINIEGVCDIVFTPTSGKQKLNLTIPENFKEIVQVYVENRTLKMRMKPGYEATCTDGKTLRLEITAPMIESAIVNGAGDIDFTTDITTPKKLKFAINGAGDITAHNIKAESIQFIVNGAGDIDLQGAESTLLRTVINGAGDVNIHAIKATKAEAVINGAGDLTWKNTQAEKLQIGVQGTGDLTVNNVKANVVTALLDGTGDIELEGVSKIANYRVSGAGNIEASSLKAQQVKAESNSDAGHIKCYASESMTIIGVKDSHGISYLGNPKEVKHLTHNEL